MTHCFRQAGHTRKHIRCKLRNTVLLLIARTILSNRRPAPFWVSFTRRSHVSVAAMPVIPVLRNFRTF
jgi:hypothetical protein